MQKWDAVCADGQTWRAPKRLLDMDAVNRRTRRKARTSRFPITVWPVRYALAIGLRFLADQVDGGREV